MNSSVLLIIQIVISILLIGTVLLQSQGTGLGSTWGGGGESYHTKRGVERVVFVATIILSILFGIISLITIVLV